MSFNNFITRDFTLRPVVGIFDLQLSPAQIIFGNSITLDRGIFREQKIRKVDEEQIPLSKWAENMQDRQKLILKLAKATQELTDDFHIVQASAKRTQFPINSYVLVKYRDRPPTKFHSNWNGPLRVVSFSNCEPKLIIWLR